MTYVDRFVATDDLVKHLQTIIPLVTDEELKSKYAGFLSASAVTVYELAIKDIFITFARKKNPVFGTFVEKHFNQINGRIKIRDLKDYVRLFGEKYLKKFDRYLKEKNNTLFTIYHNDISAIYGNIITCRHNYIHENSPTMTFNEVAEGYKLGKEVIHVLNQTMQR
jgi:hypothetical protein